MHQRHIVLRCRLCKWIPIFCHTAGRHAYARTTYPHKMVHHNEIRAFSDAISAIWMPLPCISCTWKLYSRDNLLFLVSIRWGVSGGIQILYPPYTSNHLAASRMRHRDTDARIRVMYDHWSFWAVREREQNGVPFSAILLFIETFNSLFLNRHFWLHDHGPPTSHHKHTSIVHSTPHIGRILCSAGIHTWTIYPLREANTVTFSNPKSCQSSSHLFSVHYVCVRACACVCFCM